MVAVFDSAESGVGVLLSLTGLICPFNLTTSGVEITPVSGIGIGTLWSVQVERML
ncbi:hypothetical protein Y013_00850 [Rhodococcus pyridinivorans SB3094]|uniref:Uncharacterized protein n=1 Tax=Rhodococcus pyridinivorans SB3094 TaxID=1435356 RepID=V9XNJ4_9NOCA|nr:hypothetical protein Y013_00850 [Rhodococcus pyridinivorans SB3094]